MQKRKKDCRRCWVTGRTERRLVFLWLDGDEGENSCAGLNGGQSEKSRTDSVVAFHPTKKFRGNESGQISYRVDPGDTGGGSGSGKDGGGDRPETGSGGHNPRDRDSQGDESGPAGKAGKTAGSKGQCSREGREADMKAAFARLIGMAANPDHAKGGTGPWEG